MINNRMSLGFFPTPVQPLEKLSLEHPGYTIFIKRDDHTGLAMGGNKTRKLEYLLKQAIKENCDAVITAGAQQSNHCRQTAAACSIAGLECHLLLGGEEPATYGGNLLLSKMLGANIQFTRDNRKGETIEEYRAMLETKGRKCFLIPYGGSNITGALGFVNAVKELKTQLEVLNTKMDYIFFASSSGGMQAGLMLGQELYGLESELVAINIDKDETHGKSLEEIILSILKEGTNKLGIKKDFTLGDVTLNKDYDVAGYGVLTQNELYAIQKLAGKEGIVLDPVYTGRAFFGMLDCLEKKKIPTNSNILFWHTGGIPAIFNYPGLL